MSIKSNVLSLLSLGLFASLTEPHAIYRQRCRRMPKGTRNGFGGKAKNPTSRYWRSI